MMNSLVLVDIGAAEGQDVARWLLRFENARVYAFEPDVRNFAAMMRSCGGHDRFVGYPWAVSDKDGYRRFHASSNSHDSSLLAYDERVRSFRLPTGMTRAFEMVDGYDVDTVRMDRWMAETGITTIDFLKIDTQGHDLAVVLGLGDRLEDVREIKLEVIHTPMYQGQPAREEIISVLTARGFRVLRHELLYDGQVENLWFGNARFASNGYLNLP